MSANRLTPNDGPLYVVRWIRDDGRDVKHRYFRRESDATRFLAKLRAVGKPSALYAAPATWERLR